jgi:hypothetical protein
MSAEANILQGQGNFKWDSHSHRYILPCLRKVTAEPRVARPWMGALGFPKETVLRLHNAPGRAR